MHNPTTHTTQDEIATFGFWVYLMTDCVLFASLFATYIVLHGNTYGGASSQELFNLSPVLLETFLLLTSSFTCGLAVLAAQKQDKQQTLAWLGATLLLGLGFLGMELNEFAGLIAEGHGFTQSGFLSAFFTLVGTHGLHIIAGSLWLLVLMIQIARRSLTPALVSRLNRFSLFWHFLDIIWIFIFTIVYLMGVS